MLAAWQLVNFNIVLVKLDSKKINIFKKCNLNIVINYNKKKKINVSSRLLQDFSPIWSRNSSKFEIDKINIYSLQYFDFAWHHIDLPSLISYSILPILSPVELYPICNLIKY